MPVDQTSKDLALGIVDFLKTSISNGTISPDDADSVEVAIECLSDVFKVDMENKEKIYGKNDLLSIFNAFLKLKERKKGASSTDSSTPAEPSVVVSTEDREKAMAIKAKGNDAYIAKKYDEAIDLFTQAIKLDPSVGIYYSNRAAAYSASQQHEKAVEDAKESIRLNPSFSKGYSRLGFALMSLGDAQGAMEAYQKGLQVEGGSPSDIMKKGYEAAKKQVQADLDSIVPVETDTKDTVSESSSREAPGSNPFGGLGGGAGGLDFASLMNNPELQKMAKNFMSNPSALSGLMNNPQLKKMAENLKDGFDGGVPNMDDIMKNPMLQQMAQNFMGGGKK